VPTSIVNVLCNWYSKLTAQVRWNGCISKCFKVRSGVRQGSVLSPVIFNVFVNMFITDLRAAGIGCTVKQMFLGCLMYADDIILLCPTTSGLQKMLDVCYTTSVKLSLQFNVMKSHCIAFGKSANLCMESLNIGTGCIEWCDSIKYLGMHIVSSKNIAFDINPIRRAFFAACNCVFSNCSSASEIVQLSLQESYCLPILTYSSPAVNLKMKQASSLNACWNSVYRKIFGFHKWESVRLFIYGLGRLDLHHILLMRRLKFYNHLCSASCNVLLSNLFWCYWTANFATDVCCAKILTTLCEASVSIRDSFALMVGQLINISE
jgi:hypothetical protein